MMSQIMLIGTRVELGFKVRTEKLSPFECQSLHISHSAQWLPNIQLKEKEEKPIFEYSGSYCFIIMHFVSEQQLNKWKTGFVQITA